MAVLQISKIQVRRGLKNSGIGVPQLSSAEFAWAVDTQELYIGNGSIAEGAPYVGNTKILTEHDNILELAGSYQFGYPTVTSSVPRSLQDKIDEIAVSVKDFGAAGDGTSDDADAFELAADQLFNVVTSTLKKTLIVPNGEYYFSRNINLPNGVILKGETQLGAVLNINEYNIVFSESRTTNVLFENLTIKHTTGHTDITGLADSEFAKVKFTSNYTLSDDTIDLFESNASVYWENSNFDERVTNFKFKECIFDSVILGTKTIHLSNVTTEVLFQDCVFHNCHGGSVIDSTPTQENRWIFDNCKYDKIASFAFIANKGRATVIRDTVFRNCGNGRNTPEFPVTPMVFFGEYQGNELINCSSDRSQLTDNASTEGFPIAINANKAVLTDMFYSDIGLVSDFRTLVVFGLNAQYLHNPVTDLDEESVETYMSCYKIEYILRLGIGMRKGTLVIGIDNGTVIDGPNISISDNYTYSSSSSTSNDGIRMTEFKFNAVLRDNNGDDLPDTMVLSYMNPIEHPIDDSTSIAGEPGDVTFSITYGV